MTELFERYLSDKKKRKEKVNVYLNSNQISHRTGIKSNNLMLSGLVQDVDSKSLLLEGQECLIPFHSILSIKPSGNR